MQQRYKKQLLQTANDVRDSDTKRDNRRMLQSLDQDGTLVGGVQNNISFCGLFVKHLEHTNLLNSSS